MGKYLYMDWSWGCEKPDSSKDRLRSHGNWWREWTLSEIGHALSDNKPLIALNSWRLIREKHDDPSMISVQTPNEALERLLSLAANNSLTGY